VQDPEFGIELAQDAVDVQVASGVQEIDVVELALARYGDDQSLVVRCPYRLYHFPAIHAGHGHIGDDHLRSPLVPCLDALGTAVRLNDLMSVFFQYPTDHAAVKGIVVDDQYQRHNEPRWTFTFDSPVTYTNPASPKNR
jgi:hypothetical protein